MKRSLRCLDMVSLCESESTVVFNEKQLSTNCENNYKRRSIDRIPTLECNLFQVYDMPMHIATLQDLFSSKSKCSRKEDVVHSSSSCHARISDIVKEGSISDDAVSSQMESIGINSTESLYTSCTHENDASIGEISKISDVDQSMSLLISCLPLRVIYPSIATSCPVGLAEGLRH
jgi:hypothetical protein